MADGGHSPVDVFVSIGSNIEPDRNLRLAHRELQSKYGALRLSPVYRSPAVGFEGDDFLNMVIGFRSAEDPRRILDHMEELHEKAERVRLENPFSPRTLDVDLLLYGNTVQDALKLPHSDIDEYPFVLRPLAELAPNLRHPVSGRRMQQLWADFEGDHAELTPVDFRF